MSKVVLSGHSLSARALHPVLAVGTALLLLFGLAPTPADAVGIRQLTVSPGVASSVAIGAKRTTSVASVAVTVPTTLPIDLALQFRAASTSSGYRTHILIAADGSVSGSFGRIKGGVETVIGSPESLGFSVASGDTIRLQATTTALKVVKLYLRAWKDGTAKPTAWQLAARDSSSSRIRKSGRTYLWATAPGAQAPVQVPYGSVSVHKYSAAKASKVGVVAPTSTGSAGTPSPSPTPDPTDPTPSPTVPTPSPSVTTPAAGDDTFSIAVLPDTQVDTNDPTNATFLSRTNWIAANKDTYDVRYTLHTGDVVNWGWLDTPEYTRAKAAIAVLKNAGIPYNLTIGNHDTRAVGWDGIAGSTKWGGAAYQSNPDCPIRLSAAECHSWLLVRKTAEFNEAFPLSSIEGVGGTFESGKVDNIWTSFTANNTKWLVLTIEFSPRAEAVAWAANVVATHPDYNVIIQTHHYLDGNGSITGSNDGYGIKSGSYIYSEIVQKYSNVKLVFSGHTGGFTSRTDTNNGNTTVSYLGNEISGASPVRLVTINTRTGKVDSVVYNPKGHNTIATTSNTITVVP